MIVTDPRPAIVEAVEQRLNNSKTVTTTTTTAAARLIFRRVTVAHQLLEASPVSRCTQRTTSSSWRRHQTVAGSALAARRRPCDRGPDRRALGASARVGEDVAEGVDALNRGATGTEIEVGEWEQRPVLRVPAEVG